jgi:hypothetical protein
VQVNLFVVNRSAKQITPNATLKQRQEFRAPSKCKAIEHELLGCPGNVVQPGESVFQSILLPLSLDLPLVHNCPIIAINYRIKIGIEIPRAFDMYFHLPILLTQHPLPALGPALSHMAGFDFNCDQLLPASRDSPPDPRLPQPPDPSPTN